MPFDSKRQAVIVLSAISLLVLSAILFYPFCPDNDLLQSIGFILYRYHGLPNLASWYHNFPGFVFVQAVSIAIFGNSVLGFRLFEFCVQIVIILVLYRASRLWLSRSSSFLACLLYALLYVNGPDGIMGQVDNFAVLPILLGAMTMILSFRSHDPKRQALLAIAGGMLYAVATLLRPTFALLLIVPSITVFDVRTPIGRRRIVNVGVGAAIVFIPLILLYALQSGGLYQSYLAAIRFNFDVYAPRSSYHNLFTKRALAAEGLAGWGIVTLLYHRMKGRHLIESPRDSQERHFILLTYVALLIGILSMRKLAACHFTPFFALAMPAVAAMLWEWKTRFGKSGTVGLGVLLMGLTTILYPSKPLFAFLRSGFSLKAAYTSSAPEMQFETTQCEQIASYIRRTTAPQDTVDFNLYGDRIRWRIERPSATRFTTGFPLMSLRPDGLTDYQKEWRDEYVSRIRSVVPKLFVVADIRDTSQPSEAAWTTLELPGISALLAEHYLLDTVIGRSRIYRRK